MFGKITKKNFIRINAAYPMNMRLIMFTVYLLFFTENRFHLVQKLEIQMERQLIFD